MKATVWTWSCKWTQLGKNKRLQETRFMFSGLIVQKHFCFLFCISKYYCKLCPQTSVFFLVFFLVFFFKVLLPLVADREEEDKQSWESNREEVLCHWAMWRPHQATLQQLSILMSIKHFSQPFQERGFQQKHHKVRYTEELKTWETVNLNCSTIKRIISWKKPHLKISACKFQWNKEMFS